MRHSWRLALALALAAPVLLFAACGSGSYTGTGTGSNTSTNTGTNTSAATSTSTSGTSTGGNGVVVKTATANVSGTNETILTNTQGLTLYYFDPDTATSSACTGSCTQIWPPLLLASGTPQASTSLAGALATLQDANGRQVTYNGHPLYIYGGDAKPGDTTGNGIAGKWHVATPSIPALASTSSSGSSSSSGYGNGYGTP